MSHIIHKGYRKQTIQSKSCQINLNFRIEFTWNVSERNIERWLCSDVFRQFVVRFKWIYKLPSIYCIYQHSRRWLFFKGRCKYICILFYNNKKSHWHAHLLIVFQDLISTIPVNILNTQIVLQTWKPLLSEGSEHNLEIVHWSDKSSEANVKACLTEKGVIFIVVSIHSVQNLSVGC